MTSRREIDENQLHSLRDYLKHTRRNLSDYMLDCIDADMTGHPRLRAFAAVVKDMEDQLEVNFLVGFLVGLLSVLVGVYGTSFYMHLIGAWVL